VVAKIIEVMPAESASFVGDELQGFGREAARHCFGCRVLCRIIEHASPSFNTIELFEEILSESDLLCAHPFGNHVMRHILEFGAPARNPQEDLRMRVVESLRKDLRGYAKHKFGSHVVEDALNHTSRDVSMALARVLLDDQYLMTLATNQYARHVVRALLTMPGDTGIRTEAMAAVSPHLDELRVSRYGKSVSQAFRAASSA
jgi:hypothetical protein